MKRISVALSVLFLLVFVTVTAWAAEFKYAGPPAFSITYPDDAKPDKKTSAEQVWAARTPGSLSMQAGVGDIPKGLDVKDYCEKSYKPGLADSQKTTVSLKKNEPFEFSDGTKGYYCEMEWKFEGSTLITTTLAVAYKDGKFVYATSHPWQDVDEGKEIVQSLTFGK